MADQPQFIDLPGLAKGNILAMKLGNEAQGNNYWAILGVERASILNGDITYYGNCLIFVIGDLTLTWTRMVTIYEGALVTMAQLSKVPDPPYLRKVRMQPYPDEPEMVVMDVSGLLIVDVGWTPLGKYTITFRGDWCPLFRRP